MLFNKKAEHGGNECSNVPTESCNDQPCPGKLWNDYLDLDTWVAKILWQPDNHIGWATFLPFTYFFSDLHAFLKNSSKCKIGYWWIWKRLHLFYVLLPVHCELGEWGDCDVTCGGGIRSKIIAKQAQHGGDECSDVPTESCNPQTCPVLALMTLQHLLKLDLK